MTRETAGPGTQVALPKILCLVREIQVGLLTTFDRDGTLHTRPVQTLGVEDDGMLWFFTDLLSGKAEELRSDMRVSLGYADTTANHYVAVSGLGTVRRDPRKARQLWRTEQRAYYPEGPGDERLGVLRVEIERAEYWIGPGRASYLYAALKAAATSRGASVLGENDEMRRRQP